jgi:hypothetical protein
MTQRDMSAYARGAALEYRTGTFSFRTGANAMAMTCARGTVGARRGDGSPQRARRDAHVVLGGEPCLPAAERSDHALHISHTGIGGATRLRA